MSYIRLQTAFWQHRKTLRLRAIIGEPALWVPLKLWSYAAENQPNGDFSDYTAQELALLLAYVGDAQAMLKALQEAGFLDGMKIHGWKEHNGFHAVFRARASVAAKARWLKQTTGKQMKLKERKGNKQALLQASPSNASSNACSIDKKLSMPNGLTDSEWIARLKEDKTYTDIDIDREHGKMCAWCNANQKNATRRRFINWLNRAEKPMTKPQAQDQGDGYWVKPVWDTK